MILQELPFIKLNKLIMQYIHLNLPGARACNKIFSLLHIIGFMALLLLGACQSKTDSDSELLNRALSYHDLEENWSTLKTRIYLSSADTAGRKQNFEIELDNSTGYFAHISHKDGKEVVKGFANGKEFYLLDGKQEITPEDRKKYKLTPESLKWVHSFYPYLYGLPMKLTDDGVKVTEAGNLEEIEGKQYKVLEVNFDPSVGSDNWFFYLEPATYAMKAYRFNQETQRAGNIFCWNRRSWWKASECRRCASGIGTKTMNTSAPIL